MERTAQHNHRKPLVCIAGVGALASVVAFGVHGYLESGDQAQQSYHDTVIVPTETAGKCADWLLSDASKVRGEDGNLPNLPECQDPVVYLSTDYTKTGPGTVTPKGTYFVGDAPIEVHPEGATVFLPAAEMKKKASDNNKAATAGTVDAYKNGAMEGFKSGAEKGLIIDALVFTGIGVVVGWRKRDNIRNLIPTKKSPVLRSGDWDNEKNDEKVLV